MNRFKKLFSVVICVLLGLLMSVSISATGGNTNISADITPTQVNVGDSITLTISNAAMTAQGFKAGFYFDNTKLEVTKITWGSISAYNVDEEDFLTFSPLSSTTKNKANTDGSALGVYTFNSGVDSLCEEGVFVTVTFKAIASGDAVITLREETVGTDAFKSDNVETKTVTIAAPACTHEETTTSYSKIDGQDKHTVTVTCNACGEQVGDVTEASCSGGSANCQQAATCEKCGESYGSVNATVHVGSDFATTYDKIVGQDKHTVTVTCDACGEQVGDVTEASCSGGTANCQQAATCEKCGESYGSVNATVHTGSVSNPVDNGDGTHTSKWSCCNAVYETVAHAEGYECVCGYTFTGWDGKLYVEQGNVLKTGWTKIADAWYYLDKTTGVRAEGLARVSYPEDAINDVSYAANASDKAYWEAHKDTSKYSDATTAIFVFDENGKLDQTSRIVQDGEVIRYALNGCVAWHIGFVQVGNDYYYFTGDKNGGGNVAATGKVYATRDYNDNKPVDGTSIYYFAEDGKLIQYEGIAKIDNILYYFDSDNKLACGKGLTEVENGYIYVRSGGQLAIGVYYTNGAKYEFDENGFTTGVKNGMVDGKIYKDGHLVYGLVECDGDIYYVRSNGELAKGTYYITKTNDMEGFTKGDKLIFGEDGKLLEIKNGIVEENGAYYYYQNNRLQCGAGVVEMTDDQGDTFYIYVRSNGQLATGKYWPTKLNDYLERGEYDWGTDGKYYPGK